MPFTVIGDAAFPLTTHLMRPYPGRNIPREKHIFNYTLVDEKCGGKCVQNPSIQVANLSETYLPPPQKSGHGGPNILHLAQFPPQAHRDPEMAGQAGRKPTGRLGDDGGQQGWAGSLCCEGQAVRIL
ncbi:hypothetical protein ABVT39_020060 [Epinephelus coioides]